MTNRSLLAKNVKLDDLVFLQFFLFSLFKYILLFKKCRPLTRIFGNNDDDDDKSSVTSTSICTCHVFVLGQRSRIEEVAFPCFF